MRMIDGLKPPTAQHGPSGNYLTRPLDALAQLGRLRSMRGGRIRVSNGGPGLAWPASGRSAGPGIPRQSFESRLSKARALAHLRPPCPPPEVLGPRPSVQTEGSNCPTPKVPAFAILRLCSACGRRGGSRRRVALGVSLPAESEASQPLASDGEAMPWSSSRLIGRSSLHGSAGAFRSTACRARNSGYGPCRRGIVGGGQGGRAALTQRGSAVDRRSMWPVPFGTLGASTRAGPLGALGSGLLVIRIVESKIRPARLEGKYCPRTPGHAVAEPDIDRHACGMQL